LKNSNRSNSVIDKLSDDMLQVNSMARDNFLDTINSVKSCSDIKGVLLGGSLSRKKMDRYSDVDLFCLCSPNKIDSINKILLKKLQKLESVEQVVEQGSFGWLGETITVYFSGEMYFSIDIGMVEFTKGTLFFWEPEGVILWDYRNIIANGQVASRALKGYKKFPFSSQFPVRHSVVLLRKLKKNLLRNHLWNCIEYLGKIRRNLIFLLRIHVVKKDDFLGNPDRDIEDVLPSEMLEMLNKTQLGVNRAQIAKSAFLLTDWLVIIANESVIRCETSDKAKIYWLVKELQEAREWFLKFFQVLEKE
jgi:hypothetical protein